MGFLRDSGLGAATPGSLTSIFDPGDLAGTDRAKRAKEASKKAESEQQDALERAIEEQRRASGEAQEFLSPFGGVGLQGVEQAGFLTDPQAQFDFLQSNPLFELALQNADRQTQQGAASRGRLSAGDTLEQLSNNVLLSASPLIAGQKQSITDLLGFGSGIARSQANTALGLGSDLSNLFQSQGNVAAAGIAGRNQAQAQATANQNQLASSIFGALSDPALKKNIKSIGKENGFNIYSWDWNERAEKLGLKGSSRGVLANEVQVAMPDAITRDRGFMRVNYQMIGVSHGY